MRAGLIAAIASLIGCSSLTHFDEFQAGGDAAGADGGMDAAPGPRDADLGDCPPIAESCNGDDDDCDGETDEDAELTCPGAAHSQPACIAGTCGFTCETGFADCSPLMPGCESSLIAPETCGNCETECTDATPLCGSDGRCTATCSGSLEDCSGSCVNTGTDAEHCGGCEQPCEIPNATARCRSSTCEIDTCEAGWGDCNLMVGDGCEARLDTPANCGSCGAACDPAHATESCGGGTCAILTCETGWDDCDRSVTNGCETRLDTNMNCGACASPCPAPIGSHTDVDCDASTLECVYTCDANWADCSGSEQECETDLSQRSNCGGCGVACPGTSTCTLMGGVYSCSGVENCGNGVDDDGDALADCADTMDCAGFTCVPPVPPGWSGPVQLYDGAIAGAPSCAPPFAMNAYDGFGMLNPGAHSCSPCLCSSPSGVSCSAPSVLFYPQATVMPPPDGGRTDAGRRDGGPIEAGGGCTGCADNRTTSASCGSYGTSMCTGGGGNVALDVGASTASGGMCTRSGGVSSMTSPTFSNLGRACSPTAPTSMAGCGMGRCMPRTSGAPWLGNYCVHMPGMIATCPMGPYTMRHVFHQSFTDTRTCTSCNCSTPTGVSCSGDVAFYSSGAFPCTSGYLGTFGSSDVCATIATSAPQYQFVGASDFSGGSCTASGGATTGSVTPQMAHTFCCIP
jgi:hypothetical protein